MRLSEVWNTLQIAARRHVKDLQDKEAHIDPGKVAHAVIAAHDQLPQAELYHDLIERDVREYVRSLGVSR
jgi:hypothetical protein